eukprot:Platyproteum_vivax@DN5039_c0_g1_i1.p1
MGSAASSGPSKGICSMTRCCYSSDTSPMLDENQIAYNDQVPLESPADSSKVQSAARAAEIKKLRAKGVNVDTDVHKKETSNNLESVGEFANMSKQLVKELEVFFETFKPGVSMRLVRDNGTGVASVARYTRETTSLELMVGPRSLNVLMENVENITVLGTNFETTNAEAEDKSVKCGRVRLQMERGQYATLEFDDLKMYKLFHKGISVLSAHYKTKRKDSVKTNSNRPMAS